MTRSLSRSVLSTSSKNTTGCDDIDPVSPLFCFRSPRLVHLQVAVAGRPVAQFRSTARGGHPLVGATKEHAEPGERVGMNHILADHTQPFFYVRWAITATSLATNVPVGIVIVRLLTVPHFSVRSDVARHCVCVKAKDKKELRVRASASNRAISWRQNRNGSSRRSSPRKCLFTERPE
jgi:hypothetical protein